MRAERRSGEERQCVARRRRSRQPIAKRYGRRLPGGGNPRKSNHTMPRASAGTMTGVIAHDRKHLDDGLDIVLGIMRRSAVSALRIAQRQQ
jgi:hypothetical protein